MKKSDFYLIGMLLIAALAWGSIQYFMTRTSGVEVTVTQDGVLIGRYSLNQEREQEFMDIDGGRNTLVISEGAAYISEADCPDKLCVHQKAIFRNGESLICLPHRLVVEVAGGGKSEADVIAR